MSAPENSDHLMKKRCIGKLVFGTFPLKVSGFGVRGYEALILDPDPGAL